jgi:DNA-binding NarL/FixJ family response regulator
MKVIGEADSGEELRALLAKQEADVIVSDISMPGGGLELVTRLCEEDPSRRLLILSMHPEEQYALRFVRAGARGYLAKDAAPEALVAAIREVEAGGIHVSAALKDRALRGETPAEIGLLSDREFEVLARLAGGATISEIAEALALSAKTVSTYRARLMEKLGLETTADLIRYAVEKGIGGA